MQLDNDNPWPGLESFAEDAHEFFFGRDREVKTLRDHVVDAPVTVLYGRSGLGKTSLLQAGLFPLMRTEHYLPIHVRFKLNADAEPVGQQVKHAVRDLLAVAAHDSISPSDDESLWEFLHRNDFELWDEKNYPLTPVIVLDQFEELFTLGARVPELVEEFRIALGDLAENRIPAELSARIEANSQEAERFNLRSRNYRILISLREDFLPDLESWCRLIPALARPRLRLKRLQVGEAFEAVREPAAHMMTDALARKVVGIIAGENLHDESPEAMLPDDRPVPGEVEPALLSLFCRGLNEVRKGRGLSTFDEQLIEEAKRSTLSNYYATCLRDMPPRVARFIETELITKNGFRGSFIREDAVPSHLTADELDRLISARLVRLEDRFGAPHIELTHDVLTRTVREHRDRRVADEEAAETAERALRLQREYEEKAAEREAALDRERREEQERRLYTEGVARRFRRLSALLSVVCVLALAAAGVAFWSYDRAEDALDLADAQSMETLAGRLTSEAQAILAGGQPGSEVGALNKLIAAQAISEEPDPAALLTTLRNEVRLKKAVDLPRGGVVSADGEWIAAHSDSEILLLDASSGAQVGTPLRAEGHIEDVSAGGRYLAISDDESISVWDSKARSAIGPNMPTGSDMIRKAVVSPDGRRVAAVDWEGTLRLWNTATGLLVGSPFHDDERPIFALVFSPDGRQLATGGTTNNVQFRDAATGAVTHETTPDADPRLAANDGIYSLAYSPDGKLIAAGGRTVGLGTLISAGTPLRVWKTDIGTPAWRPEVGNFGDIESLAFSPDGNSIVTSGSDKAIRFWDVVTGRQVGSPLTSQQVVDDIAFSKDGNEVVAVSSGVAQVIDVDPDAAITSELQVSRDIHLSSYQAGYGLDTTRDNARIMLLEDGVLRRWDTKTGIQVSSVASSELLQAREVGHSRDERWLAAVGRDADVRVIDTQNGRPYGTPLKGHTGVVTDVDFSPDGRLLVTGSEDNTVRLWDWRIGRQIGEPMTGHEYHVARVSFSDDGRRIFTQSLDSVRVWDTATRTPVGKPAEGVFESMAFSADGRRMATSGFRGIQQWDVESGEPLGAPFGMDNDEARDLSYSPDGRYLVSISGDNALRFWNSGNGRPVGEPVSTVPVGHATFVAFSYDGRSVYIVAQPTSLNGEPPFVGGGIWELPAPAAWKDALCEKLTANPTDTQWDNWVSDAVEKPETDLCPANAPA